MLFTVKQASCPGYAQVQPGNTCSHKFLPPPSLAPTLPSDRSSISVTGGGRGGGVGMGM